MRIPDGTTNLPPAPKVEKSEPVAPAAKPSAPVESAKAAKSEKADVVDAGEAQSHKAEAMIDAAAGRASVAQAGGFPTEVTTYGGPPGSPPPAGVDPNTRMAPSGAADTTPFFGRGPIDGNEIAFGGVSGAPSMQELDSRIAKYDRNIKELPQWSINDQKLWAMNVVDGTLRKEFVLPTNEQLRDNPMVQRFNVENVAAARDYKVANEFYQMSKNALANGDDAGAKQFYELGLAHDKTASQHVKRNLQWLDIRHDKVNTAMDKHEGELKWMLVNLGMGMGADAYLAGKAFQSLTKGFSAASKLLRLGQGAEQTAKSFGYYEKLAKMDMPEAMQFLKVGEAQAAKELNHARGVVLKDTLSDPAKLARANPEELAKYSGYAMKPEEVKTMVRNLTAAERRAAEAEGLTRDLLGELGGIKEADAFKLQEILQDPVKLANTKATDLIRLSKSTVQLTEADAKLLISNADSMINKSVYDMPLDKAAAYLERMGNADGAKVLKEFYGEVRGHANIVSRAGEVMKNDVLPGLRKMNAEQLMEKYPALTKQQADAVLKDIKSMPENFSFAYHDLLTSAGKTRTDIAAQLGKNASPKTDITLQYAIDRHNNMFAHHGPNDPLSRLESATDFIAALRQNRSYKDGFGWDKVSNIVNEGPKLKTQIQMVRDAAPDPAQAGWNQIMLKEMQNVEKSLGKVPNSNYSVMQDPQNFYTWEFPQAK
jgi:hypothetical protein